MRILLAFLIGLTAYSISTGNDAPNRASDSTPQLLAKTNIQGGLIVHLGCGDAKQTAKLRATDAFVVHGLDADPAKIAEARQYLREQALYGPISVEHWTGTPDKYRQNCRWAASSATSSGSRRPSAGFGKSARFRRCPSPPPDPGLP